MERVVEGMDGTAEKGGECGGEKGQNGKRRLKSVVVEKRKMAGEKNVVRVVERDRTAGKVGCG